MEPNIANKQQLLTAALAAWLLAASPAGTAEPAKVGASEKVMTPPTIESSENRVRTTLDPGMKRIGTLNPRPVGKVGTSMWMIGCETLDRDFQNYDSYKEYLAPLGIQLIRLQGGWAKTEQQRGKYDFGWLDAIIDDARSRGLQIMLETSYGNPSYPGGGGRTLSGGFPTSPEAVAAWDRWVEAMATRYKDKVAIWGMWNEPTGNPKLTASDITEFNIRTAAVIKRVHPKARIAGLVVNRLPKNIPVIEHFLKTLSERQQTDLFEWVVFHCYDKNPDAYYPSVKETADLVRRFAPAMKLWQGEAGAQSELCKFGALSGHPWTELTQAKWNTRRMLGDLGHGVASGVFTIADLEYHNTPGHEGLLRYGLLQTTGQAEGFQVRKIKMAYYAVQNVVSVFNDTLERIPDYSCEARGLSNMAVFGYRDIATGSQVCVFWNKIGTPTDKNETKPATLTITGAEFHEPVWVDVITGGIYAIPAEKIKRDGDKIVFEGIPTYDAPTFIAERKVVIP